MSSVAKKLAMACNAGFFLGIMTAVPSFGQTCTTGATCSSGPSTCGEWSFVYDLNDDLTAEYSLTQEIVHGAVLPPDDLSAQVIQRVLFVPALSYNCQSSSNPPCVPQTPQLYGRSYVWKPNRNPHTVEAVPVPTSPVAFPQDGTQDLFCGGHCFLADGSLLWIGGTDMQRTCTDTPTPCNSEDVVFFGHKGAWRLDTSTATPAWSKAGTGQHTDTMEFERWYPTATLMGDGTAMATGHTLQPFPISPALAHDFWRDEYDPSTNTWNASGYLNKRYGDCTTAATDVRLGEYPRLLLLPNGTLMHPNPFALAGPLPSQYLDVKQQTAWSCSPFGPAVRRWRQGLSTPDTNRLDAGAVLLVTWDPGTDTFKTTVYTVGGSKKFFEDNQCQELTSADDILCTVERLEDPKWDSTFAWTDVSQLNYGRANHNTVLLLDGSILVVGGRGRNGPDCVWRTIPERYKPVEVFGGSNPVWEPLAAQSCNRGYHSVAGLLQSGKVFSAGGLGGGNCNSVSSARSVEVFSPPYATRTDRPEIDLDSLDPTVTKDYQASLIVEVQVTPGRTIDRVGLLRNGSMTHAFDMDQRYVELRILTIVETTPGSGTYVVTVQLPDDEYFAPPGYYMLTVVDGTQVPSEARWLRIDQL